MVGKSKWCRFGCPGLEPWRELVSSSDAEHFGLLNWDIMQLNGMLCTSLSSQGQDLLVVKHAQKHHGMQELRTYRTFRTQ